MGCPLVLIATSTWLVGLLLVSIYLVSICLLLSCSSISSPSLSFPIALTIAAFPPRALECRAKLAGAPPSLWLFGSMSHRSSPIPTTVGCFFDIFIISTCLRETSFVAVIIYDIFAKVIIQQIYTYVKYKITYVVKISICV